MLWIATKTCFVGAETATVKSVTHKLERLLVVLRATSARTFQQQPMIWAPMWSPLPLDTSMHVACLIPAWSSVGAATMRGNLEPAVETRTRPKPSISGQGEPPRASMLAAITHAQSSMTPRSSAGDRITSVSSVLVHSRTPTHRPPLTPSVRGAQPFPWQPLSAQFVLCSTMVQSSAGVVTVGAHLVMAVAPTRT